MSVIFSVIFDAETLGKSLCDNGKEFLVVMTEHTHIFLRENYFAQEDARL
jgi:hypothetical protein